MNGRQFRWFLLATFVTCSALGAAAASAADRVKLLAGTQSTGKLTEISPTELTIELGSTKKRFAVNQVESVQFDAEPSDLTQARTAILAGHNEDALAHLNKIDLEKVERAEIRKDIDYYKALSAARLALAGSGSKAEAGKKLVAAEKANRNSFHYFEACETLGDLLSAMNKPADAANYYNKLAEAPWPAYKLRAGVLQGRALLAQKDYDGAIAKFDDVLAEKADDIEGKRQLLGAELGKCQAQAAAGKHEAAIQSIEAIIAKADPENAELHARAYTLLGNCYLEAGRKKEALLAFLHVDLLYPRFAEQHAEALAKLANLWTEVNHADRAAAARATLKEKYPDSAWAIAIK